MKLINPFRRDGTVRREATIVLTDAEYAWWSAHGGIARRRALVIAVTGTSIGVFITFGLIAWLKQAFEVAILKHDISFGSTVFQVVVFALVGWRSLLRAERDKAIRSRRLRFAMELEDERILSSIVPPERSTSTR